MKTKGELIRDIILNLEEPAKYADIQEKFEEKSSLEVSMTRIKQIAKDMEEKDEIEIKREINDKGNAIVYIHPID